MARTFDLSDYLKFLARRRLLWVGGVAAASVIAGGVSLAAPTRYRATVAVVIIPPQGEGQYGLALASPAYLNSLRTYADFALSRELIEQAPAALNLPSLARLDLDDVLTAEVPNGSRTLRISATLADPAAALRLARWTADRTVAKAKQLDSPERLAVFDRGRAPRKPVQTRPLVRVLGAAFFALILTFAYLTLRYGLERDGLARDE